MSRHCVCLFKQLLVQFIITSSTSLCIYIQYIFLLSASVFNSVVSSVHIEILSTSKIKWCHLSKFSTLSWWDSVWGTSWGPQIQVCDAKGGARKAFHLQAGLACCAGSCSSLLVPPWSPLRARPHRDTTKAGSPILVVTAALLGSYWRAGLRTFAQESPTSQTMQNKCSCNPQQCW